MLSNRLGLSDLDDADIKGKRVLMKVDYGCQFGVDGDLNESKILATIPTITCLFNRGVKSIVVSNCDYPSGPRGWMRFHGHPATDFLRQSLGRSVTYLTRKDEIVRYCARIPDGSLLVLGNISFDCKNANVGYLSNTSRISLQTLGDIFIAEAFSMSHIRDGPEEGISMPIRAAGFVFEKELGYFSQILDEPQRPLVAILGADRVKDKITMMMHLLDKVDVMVIGGGMAITFLKVIEDMQADECGYDEECVPLVPWVLARAKERKVKLVFPCDFICKADDAAIIIATIASDRGIPAGYLSVDIGPGSIAQVASAVAGARTILWDGLQGFYHNSLYCEGSLAIMDIVTEATRRGCTTVATGSEAVDLITETGTIGGFSHVSSGGDASASLLGGKELPGVKSLRRKGEYDS